jgi:NAD(P)-dependent dehydrogenase (short-subunit alcohol dehydrogenase family)
VTPTQARGGRLAGKRAIITGAASGIGRASALAFADEGAWVTCVDLDKAALDEVAEAIRAAGGNAMSVVADVTDEADTLRMAAETVEAWDRIDVLYANAGIAGNGRAGEVSRSDWDRVLAVNLTGTWLSVKAVLPVMCRQRAGSIICQASVGGVVGVPGIAAYAASKGGLIALVKQMTVDYSPLGIRINAIAPGTVWTKLVADSVRELVFDGNDFDAEPVKAAAGQPYPLGRIGTTEQVAATAVHLAGDESAWTTGTVALVDGGLSASGYLNDQS